MAHEAVAGGSPVDGGLAGWTIRVLAACAQFGGIAWPASIPPHAVLGDVLSKMESTWPQVSMATKRSARFQSLAGPCHNQVVHRESRISIRF